MFLRLDHLAIKDRIFSLEGWLVFNFSYVIMFSPFIHSSFILSLVTHFPIFTVVNSSTLNIRLKYLLEIRDFIFCRKAMSHGDSVSNLFRNLDAVSIRTTQNYTISKSTRSSSVNVWPPSPHYASFLLWTPSWLTWGYLQWLWDVYLSAGCLCCSGNMYFDGSPKLSTWWHTDSPGVGWGHPLSTLVRDCLH